MSNNIVKRLRDGNLGWVSDHALEAADRIEALEGEVKAILQREHEQCVALGLEIKELRKEAEAAEARAERLRMVLEDAVAWMNGCAVSGGYPAWHAKAIKALEDKQ